MLGEFKIFSFLHFSLTLFYLKVSHFLRYFCRFRIGLSSILAPRLRNSSESRFHLLHHLLGKCLERDSANKSMSANSPESNPLVLTSSEDSRKTMLIGSVTRSCHLNKNLERWWCTSRYSKCVISSFRKYTATNIEFVQLEMEKPVKRFVLVLCLPFKSMSKSSGLWFFLVPIHAQSHLLLRKTPLFSARLLFNPVSLRNTSIQFEFPRSHRDVVVWRSFDWNSVPAPPNFGLDRLEVLGHFATISVQSPIRLPSLSRKVRIVFRKIMSQCTIM